MARHSYFCIDGHACGNPVRVVAGGAPPLKGKNMQEKRAHFMSEYDWVRTGLMYEPRGHAQMSGTILYPATQDECDIALLFIETSGCLPMCGHGTIGTVTILIEQGLVIPKTPGILKLETPAGVVTAEYQQNGPYVEEVRLTNVASFLYQSGMTIECPNLGPLTLDIAYGGNFYAIIDPQTNYRDMADYSAGELIRFSQQLRPRLNDKFHCSHPEQAHIQGLHHILWTGAPIHPEATARNAVFYGESALDRSPCGTGTSARMAQWAAHGKLEKDTCFNHESIIGSLFKGYIKTTTKVGRFDAIIPSFAGWGQVTGLNTLFIDSRDPFCHGFSVV